jgi:class 3 adenylate cyclase/predicted ATPase
MRQIIDWLGELGLSQYAQCFADNDIDFGILEELTDQDLEKIGVVSLGHRRRILKAVAELEDPNQSANAGAVDAPPDDARPQDSAERRQVTVMFSDLVGSTQLCTRLDPEDMRSLIAAYHRCVAETVVGFDGFIAKYMGDGVLIYFGYPRAHEDDAERAVRVGLALIEAVASLPVSEPLHVRIGIATGLVVVGDIVGSGEAQERGIVGETPNLAARLQAIAEPNMVVLADGTRRLLGDLFELRNLGARDLKGIAGPVRAWAAVRACSVESRFDALHATGLTDLIGREEDLDLLLRRWSRAETGEGQVVLLSGEAGIGKSRLTVALLEKLRAEPHTRLRYFCSPQRTDSVFYPIIGQIERAAGLVHDDTPRRRLDKLDALLALSSTSREDAALLAEMLSLANDGRYPTLELSAQERRQRTLKALDSQIEALSRSNPLLMIFEDAHWIDPTSLEAFGRIVDLIANRRVLLIVTFRPEFQAPWIGRPHVTSLTINRLMQRDVSAMIDHVLGNSFLPTGIRQDIVERTDGIPLFVEEMTKAVLEASSEGEARLAVAAIPSPALAVPASLHASLLARLDRLGSAREMAQIGAAIGREFSHALLAAVARKPEAELASALDRLIQAGLLFRQGVPPHATYLFKHALVQDTAYGTLLRDSRRALHARIAESLETEFAEIAQNQPELLAHHCSEAGLVEKAAILWGKAGQRSLARSALAEATEQLSRALGMIATLPPTPALRREQIDLQVALITPLMHIKGYAAPETKAAAEEARLLIERAEALGEPPQDPLLPFSVIYGFWVVNYVAFDGEAMRKFATQFLELAEKQGTRIPLMMGHRLMATSLHFAGEIAESRRHYDQALALFDPAEHRPLAARFGQDVDVGIVANRSFTLWLLGYPDAALADADQAVSIAREIGHATTLMYALFHATLTHIHTGDYPRTWTLVDELVALAEEKGAPFWAGGGIARQGCLLALAGEAAKAIQAINSGLAILRPTATTVTRPWYLTILARCHAELGQSENAGRHIDEAMIAIKANGEIWLEAEIQRTAGELALLASEPDAAKAEAHFARALLVSRAQQAKSWELRATISMARLWRDQGKRQQARDLITPIYNWFTEGFDTLDLQQAKALCDELMS